MDPVEPVGLSFNPVQPEEESSKVDESGNKPCIEHAPAAVKEKRKWIKKVKVPNAIRRQRINSRLSKLLTPKSALIILEEMLPGCTYDVVEQSGSESPVFTTTVQHESRVLGTGQGDTRELAQSLAAENAIKTLVSEVMSRPRPPPPPTEVKPDDGGVVPMDLETKTESAARRGDMGEDLNDPIYQLHWAGLASFAMYKLFNAWQDEGTGAPVADIPVRVTEPPKLQKPPRPPFVRADLPPNAYNMHPTHLLNIMRPDLVGVELQRSLRCREGTVTVGFEVDSQMFTGTASNRKLARREAAKAVLTALHGMTFPEN